MGWPEFRTLGPDAVPTGDTLNIARGLPLELLETGALMAAGRAAHLAGTSLLRRFVSEACDLVLESSHQELYGALSERLGKAEDLVKRYITAIEAKK